MKLNPRHIIVAISGVIFGFGLAMSQMTKPEVVLSFLHLQDLGLLFVLLPAAIICGTAIQLARRSKLKAPVTKLKYTRRNYPLGKNTIIGAILFGLGWGIAGVCPGAAYASLGIGNWPILLALIGMLLGSLVWHQFVSAHPKNKVVKDFKI